MTELERLIQAKIPGRHRLGLSKARVCDICAAPGAHCGLNAYVKGRQDRQD